MPDACGDDIPKNVFIRGGDKTMTPIEATEYINNRPEQYLKRAKKSGYICPICGNGSGKNGTGMEENKNKPKHFTCFKCNELKNATVVNILAAESGITNFSRENFKEVIEAATRRAGIVLEWGNDNANGVKLVQAQNQDLKPKFTISPQYRERCIKALPKTNYFSFRGISQNTLDNFIGNIGYDENLKARPDEIWQAVIFFIGDHFYEARNTNQNSSKDSRFYKQGKQEVFNSKALQSDEPIFITEGTINALSIIEVGGQAIAAGGTSGVSTIERELKKGNIKSPCFIIAFDKDQAGQENTPKMELVLKTLGYSYIISYIPQNIDGDLNDYLKLDRKKFIQFIQEEKERALEKLKNDEEKRQEELKKNSALNLLPLFAAEIEKTKQAYKTGFTQLNNILDGGLYAGVYTIGAESGVGKTTFCLQICDNIAQAGNDVIIISLEMSKFELIAKSLSRISYLISKENENLNPATTRNILSNKYTKYKQMEKTVLQAMNKYMDFAERIFIYEGVGDIGTAQIREVVDNHIKTFKRRPVLLIDYVQILAPPSDRLTDKQAIDKNILELKRLSRDANIPIIAVSSFNRESYGKPITMAALKESGALEYSSDVVLGLQPLGMDYREGESDKDRIKRIVELRKTNRALINAQKPIDVQLKMLKNRNGKREDVIFSVDLTYNYYDEIRDEETRWEKYD